MPEHTTVHILLATFNGARYLDEQLESIARQTYSNWTLTVSDDGSSDNTLSIVEHFATQVTQEVTLLQGPKQGSSTANFYHLLSQAPSGNTQDLFAFCDQDDVWHDDKLERAVRWHAQHHQKKVRLYCSRTQFVNDQLQSIRMSPGIKHSPSFGNALVQNIASGNTMVFSHALLMAQKKIHSSNSIWHDWTTYIVATALDGLVIFDDKPSLFYRQHSNNVIGSNDGIKAQIARLKPILEGRLKIWYSKNSNAVEELHDLVAQGPREIFTDFQKMRTADAWHERVLIFFLSKVRRQGFLSNITLAFALLINSC